ncbi:MAG: hypothetical protein JJU30_05445 [Alkalimonas sp.]|uniref:Cytochrome oxidase Cu insertion factor, SCO1/SenC/PrrC family n=1 Tax=Alkalimonas delamerensis TaxID=265981 RepID=A0ABT9GTM2_9GAMM|nr:hypothetical protein [Alkalimonas delamerensis]MCC5852259.1 hypothetical protein [Alkalimonas sp.]MDP4530324.1 hypothetical protein [Alkalimonas delamerensis]
MNKTKFLSIFLPICLLPLLLAKLALHFEWFEGGTASQGEWMPEEVFVLPGLEAHEKVWRLAVIPANDCTERCQQGLHTVQQLFIGLGRKQVQVQPWLLSTEPADTILQQYPVFQQQPGANSSHAAVQNYIVIVDVQGLALLRYPLPNDEQLPADIARAIRSDLLKLMNYDRIRV